MMKKLLEDKYDAIRRISIYHRVEKLEVFGSILRDDFHDKSDVDILVSFKTMPIADFAENFFSLEEGLRGVFDREIDLLITKEIKNKAFLSSILNQRIVLYECK